MFNKYYCRVYENLKHMCGAHTVGALVGLLSTKYVGIPINLASNPHYRVS